MYNSLYLIRKDFVLVRKFMLFLIPYYIWMAFMNLDTYSMFAALPSMLLLINSCTLDVQQKNQRFLISLPVRRQELVLAKYISILPYALLGAICTLVLFAAAGATGHGVGPSFWREVGMTLALFPLIAAVYLPVYFWLGPKGSQIVNVVFMLVIFLGMSSIGSLTQNVPFLRNWLDYGLQNNILPYVIAGIAYLFFMSCSYLISLQIFKRKDI